MRHIRQKPTTPEELDAARWRLKDSITVQAPEQLQAVAYISLSAGRCSAMGYSGKRCNPDWHYTFKSEQQARDYIAKYFLARAEEMAHKREWAAKKQEGKCYGVADVYAKACKDHYISAPEVAICLRASLARHFPGVKFAVRSDHSLNVSWTDGPSVRAVQAIARRYSFQGFDGMIDMRYSISRWLAPDGEMSLARSAGTAGSMGSHDEAIGDPNHPQAVEISGGADFVFCSRSISPAVKRQLTQQVISRYGLAVALPPDDTELERFLNTTLTEQGEYLCQLVYRASTETETEQPA